MDKIVGPFTAWELIYAAVMAFVITQLIVRFRMVKQWMDQEKTFAEKEIDLSTVINKCRIMFPIDTINFNGKVLHMGMHIRITTDRKRMIEGQLVGRNDKNMVCIITTRHIIAHELEKIIEISILEQEKNT